MEAKALDTFEEEGLVSAVTEVQVIGEFRKTVSVYVEIIS
jgi:hypothetical protein